MPTLAPRSTPNRGQPEGGIRRAETKRHLPNSRQTVDLDL
jgi:hypothetical protein